MVAVKRFRHMRVELSDIERSQLAEELMDARRTDNQADVRFEYITTRGLKGHGGGDYYTEGYDDLHGVSFIKVVSNLQKNFPGESLVGLDVGAGNGVAARQLVDYSKDDPGMFEMEMHGTNLVKRETYLPKECEHIMPGHRLGFKDDTFHFVVSSEAATRHGKRLDLILDEMYRVTKPGGQIYFHGTPHYTRDELKNVLEGFEDKHGVQVKNVFGEAYTIMKPKAKI